jgi:hypothetical protein
MGLLGAVMIAGGLALAVNFRGFAKWSARVAARTVGPPSEDRVAWQILIRIQRPGLHPLEMEWGPK